MEHWQIRGDYKVNGRSYPQGFSCYVIAETSYDAMQIIRQECINNEIPDLKIWAVVHVGVDYRKTFDNAKKAKEMAKK